MRSYRSGVLADERPRQGPARLDPALQGALLRAQTEALLDGILFVSGEGRILLANRRFAEIWGVPDDVLASGSDDAALTFVRDKLRDPDEFVERVEYLYRAPRRDEPRRDPAARRGHDHPLQRPGHA